MNITFSTEDMIKALETSGYDVKLEEMEIDVDRLGVEKEMRKVWIIRKDGQEVCSWGQYGTFRLRWAFEREIEKRLLKLF